MKYRLIRQDRLQEPIMFSVAVVGKMVLLACVCRVAAPVHLLFAVVTTVSASLFKHLPLSTCRFDLSKATKTTINNHR